MQRLDWNINFKTGLALAVLSLSPVQLLASTTISTINYPKVDQSTSEKESKPSNFSGSLGFSSNTLMEDVGEVVGNRHHTDFELKYLNKSADGVTAVFDSAARVNSENQLMFSVPEAKIGYQFGANEIVVGRSILDWSPVDAAWGFGKLNNRQNFDGFEPKQEGLTGFQYNRHGDSGFKFGVFASVLYIPEMNPGQKIDKDKGTVECQNAWCKAPAQEAPISDDVTVPIYYNVNYPEITDVVFRYSLGVRVGYDKGPFAIEAFGMRKPENQISTSAEIKYEVDNNRVFADITPQIYYHDVAGGTVKVRPTKDLTLYGSAIGIYPSKYPDGDQPYIEYTGIKPEKRKEEYVGGGVSYNYKKINTGLNYVARVSKFDKENDILAEYPRWNQAVNTFIYTTVFNRVNLGVDLKYDMLTEDRLAMYKADFQITKNLRTALGVNVIGSGSDASYWSDFTNNDSVYGSLTYKF